MYISDKGGQVGPQLTTFLEKFTAQKKSSLKIYSTKDTKAEN